MPKLFDLVKVNTATTGTGTITFGSVFSPEFFTPSEVGAVDGDKVRYVLIDGTDIELGEGTIGGSVTTMTRTVVKSRIGGAAGTSKINLSGTAYVAFTAAAADIVNPANNLNDLANAATSRSNLGISDTLPTTQVFTSGSGTYTTPANVLWIEVELVGAGGGGGGGGSSPGNGGAGGNTTFGSALLTANGGSGATGASGGAGGTASGGLDNITGTKGQNGSGVNNTAGGNGGVSPRGGVGWGGAPGGGNGIAAVTNSGSGGGGGGCFTTPNGGGGGGAGGYVRAVINNPSATYSYAVGAAGTAGTAGGGSGGAGAAGGSGVIIVTEHYGP
jgi:hypothetical protein